MSKNTRFSLSVEIEQASVGWDIRICLERSSSQARTGVGNRVFRKSENLSFNISGGKPMYLAGIGPV